MFAFESEIKWCTKTQTLSGWTTVNGTQVHVSLPRNMIHRIPMYNDAIEREIEHYKSDIIERLKPYFVAQTAE
jgi:hypothetical protein